MTDQNTTPSDAPTDAPSDTYIDVSGKPASPELIAQTQHEMKARAHDLQREIAARYAEHGAVPYHLKQQLREIQDFRFENGPVPEAWRVPPTAEELSAEDKDSHGFSSQQRQQLEESYSPARPEDYGMPLHGRARDVATENPEVIGPIRDIAAGLGLPKAEGNLFISSFLESVDAETGDFERVAPGSDRHAELESRAVSHFKSRESYEEADRLASRYLESTLSPEQLRSFGELVGGTPLLYDGPLLQRLAALARMRGIR